MSSFRKRLIIFLSITIITLIVLGLSLNFILSSIATKTLDNKLDTINKSSGIFIDIGKLKINVFSSTLIFKDVEIRPDSASVILFNTGKFNKPSQKEFFISDIRVKGYSIVKLLFHKEIEIKKILISDASLLIRQTKNYIEDKNIQQEKSLTISDSINIPMLKNGKLGTIDLNNFKLNVINIDRKDTVFKYNSEHIDIEGIEVAQKNEGDEYSKFDTKNLQIIMSNQNIDLRNERYLISFSSFLYSNADSSIELRNFTYKPKVEMKKLAASYKFDKEVLDIEATSLNMVGVKLGKFLNEGLFDLDEMVFESPKIKIFKDKNNPPDYDRNPLFPQQILKQLKEDINIDKIYIKDGYFSYSELSPKSTMAVFVDMTDLNADIQGVTSLEDSISSDKKLWIDVNAKLNGIAAMNLQIMMPYNSSVDTFYFSGGLGTCNLVPFNKALYPATGIKFKNGDLTQLTFSVKASPKRSEGQLLMLYDNLEAEVTKLSDHETDKTLSWLANLVLPSSNPSKRGRVKTAKIEFERVSYKGFGNLLWKSVQSGLVNTISPIGKTMVNRKNKKKRKE
ncbi:MAG: hypothetical protein C0595_12220 [Marinilabiliales bacterium]|nr:MAG: hypothetical protein C0595_12220 [Marinilabiliales bacterium]